MADIFLWEDFKVSSAKPETTGVTDSGVPDWCPSPSPPLMGPRARKPRRGKVHRPRAVGARGHIVHSEVLSLLLPECRTAQPAEPAEPAQP